MYVWKEHTDARNSKKCVSFWRKLQILMPNIVYFASQFRGSFGGWWHKVRARGAKRGIIFNTGILLIINMITSSLSNLNMTNVFSFSVFQLIKVVCDS